MPRAAVLLNAPSDWYCSYLARNLSSSVRTEMASTEKQVRMLHSLLVFLLISINVARGAQTLSVNPAISTRRAARSADFRNPVNFNVPVSEDSPNIRENPSFLHNVEGSSVVENAQTDKGPLRQKRQSNTFTLSQSDQDSVRILPANSTSVVSLV